MSDLDEVMALVRGLEERVARLEGSGSARRGKRLLPQGWQPSDAVRAWAGVHTPAVDVDREGARFTDWARATNRAYADWEAAFRNWLRNSRPAPGRGPLTPSDQLRALFQEER